MAFNEDSVSIQDAVLNAIKNDREFVAIHGRLRAAMEPYIAVMPYILEEADILHLSATFHNLHLARIAYWRMMLRSNFIQDIACATPDDSPALEYVTREELPGVINYKLICTIEASVKMINGLTSPMAPVLNDRDLMLNPSMNLNIHAKTLYELGKLTIRALLTIQPMLIFKYE